MDSNLNTAYQVSSSTPAEELPLKYRIQNLGEINFELVGCGIALAIAFDKPLPEH